MGLAAFNLNLELFVDLTGIAGEEDFGDLARVVDIFGIAGAEAFGSQSFESIIDLSGIAGAEGLGDLTNYITYSYEPDGGEVEISGAAETAVIYFYNLDIEWQVKTVLRIDKTFSWDVGIQEARWYRVQGCCKFPTAAGDGIGAGIPGGCDVIGLETDDTSCAGALGKQQFIQNIVANGLSDLCQKLQDSRLRWEICSIKRFSRPADGRFVEPDDDCNVLTEVPFCDIPACIEICLNTDAVIDMRMSVTAQTIMIYQGSGTVETGGAAETSTDGTSGITNYLYTPDGGEVVISGSAETDLATYTVSMEMAVTVEDEEAVFNIEPETPEIPDITDTVSTGCGVCDAMPLLLNFTHNLSKAGVLVEFLQRNGLTIPDTLVMHYSSKLRAWVANYHLSGIGDDNLNSQEQWRMSFDWSCVNEFAGISFGGSSYWKFSMLVRRYNTTVGTDFDTRMVVIFPPGDFCTGNQSFAFNFSFIVNTLTHYVDNDLVSLNEIVLADNIGLFKSRSWVKNPLLRLRITKGQAAAPTQYQNIYPIFPQPVPQTL